MTKSRLEREDDIAPSNWPKRGSTDPEFMLYDYDPGAWLKYLGMMCYGIVTLANDLYERSSA